MKRHGDAELGSVRYLLLYIQHSTFSMIRKLRLSRRKLIFGVICLVCLIWFIRYIRFRNLEWDFGVDDDSIGHVRDPGMKHDKWIIVTTIQNPTEAMKALNNLPGWKLLVVGDRKTQKSWSLPGAIYLSIAAQKKLDYAVHRLLPYDSYTRKIIGYLYAIEHGADYIYETDDDNFPSPGPDSFQLSLGFTEALIVNTQNLTYNPYRHFGQSTTWPRGYPLEYVGLPDSHNYHICKIHVPPIQQGLVSGDPDMDAMFRLTRLHGKGKLDMRFDNGAPPVILPKGTFAPMNTQNTLFTGKALWALVLPTTVSDRATDIYRSYWAQRLLWLLGESTGFFPPNSFQKRNPHSSLQDAKEEAEIYQNIGHLTRFLRTWSCDAMFFFDCASRLTHDMVRQGFYESRDAEIVDAWITDLATVGYAPPSLKVRDLCASEKETQVIFYPDEQNTTLPQSSKPVLTSDLTNHEAVKEILTKTCDSQHDIHYDQIINSVRRQQNIILVVGITDTDSVPFIEAAHRPQFPHIVYCSSASLDPRFFHEWRLSYIYIPGDEVTGTNCMLEVMEMNHNVPGYLYISDHTWMSSSLEQPSRHPDLMWITGEVDVYKPEMEGLCERKKLSCLPISKDLLEQFITMAPNLPGETKFRSELRQCLVKFASDPNFVSKAQLTWITDFSFYIPRRLKPMMGNVNLLFESSKTKRKYNFLTPLLLECLELTVEYLHYSMLADLGSSKDVHYILPFNFRELPQTTESDQKSHFCQHFQDLNH